MVKIQVKKEMGLLELIKYIIENDIKEQAFEIYDYESGYWKRAVDVNKFGRIYFVYGESGKFTLDDTFIVKVEEEVTEETVIPSMLEIKEFDEVHPSALFWEQSRIRYIRDYNSKAFYKMNPDSTLTLLWTKEGGIMK